METLVVDPCNPLLIPLCEPLDGCCTTRWNQVILDNALLRTEFSDRAVVRRILGNMLIWFDPQIDQAVDVDEQYARLATSYGSLFCQLLVRPVNASGVAELPPDIWDTTSVLSGFSESKAKKTWWHHWSSNQNFGLVLGDNAADPQDMSAIRPKFEDCVTGLVNQCITRSQLTGGDGFTWDYTAPGGIRLTGECVPCGSIDLTTRTAHGQLAMPKNWLFTFDIKKRISLREDEQLILDFQGRMPFSQFFPGSGQFAVYGGGIKTLLEF